MNRIMGRIMVTLAVALAVVTVASGAANAASHIPTVHVEARYLKGQTVYPDINGRGSFVYGQSVALLQGGKVIRRGDYSLTPPRPGTYRVRTVVEYALAEQGGAGPIKHVTYVDRIKVGGVSANDRCMSRSEFGTIKVGMHAAKVFKIVGSKGRVTLASSYLTVRQWDNCASEYGVGSIGFSHGKVQSKVFI